MEHKKEIGYKREFLNEPYLVSTNSNISYSVSVNTWRGELKDIEQYDNDIIHFKMSDCNKTIDLEFEITTKENRLRCGRQRINLKLNVISLIIICTKI